PDERRDPEGHTPGVASGTAVYAVVCRVLWSSSLIAASSAHAAAMASALTNLLARAGPAALWINSRSSGLRRKANTTRSSGRSLGSRFSLGNFFASRLAMARSAAAFRSGLRRGSLRTSNSTGASDPPSGLGWTLAFLLLVFLLFLVMTHSSWLDA